MHAQGFEDSVSDETLTDDSSGNGFITLEVPGEPTQLSYAAICLP